jgi:hypothetical protein
MKIIFWKKMNEKNLSSSTIQPVQELSNGHDRDSLERFQAQEMTVSGDDCVGPGVQGAGEEYTIGRVLRDRVADMGDTWYQDPANSPIDWTKVTKISI